MTRPILLTYVVEAKVFSNLVRRAGEAALRSTHASHDS